MQDASLTAGKIHIDEKFNHNVYGFDVKIESIIDGSVVAPPHFAPVYKAIAALATNPEK